MSEEQMTPIRARVANILIVGVLALLAPVAVIGMVWWLTGQPPELFNTLPPQLPPPNTVETLIVAPGAPVTTANAYSGTLTLVVEGSINPDGLGLADVFYRHTDNLGGPLSDPVPLDTQLQVNGQPPDVARPEYDPFHVYSVRYNAGNTAQPIEFAVAGDAQGGRFRVFVVEDAGE